MQDIKNNPLINPSKKLKFDAIPFDEIKREHFLPAVEYAIEVAKQNIDKIKNNPELPTFENTLVAMETASDLLDKVTSTYYNLMSAESDNEFKELAQKISPMVTAFSHGIFLDEKLFERVKYVKENIDEFDLDNEDKRLVEVIYKKFVRNGALLDKEKKEELKKIDLELSKLSPKFSQNLLNSQNEFELLITDEKRLSGLPENAKIAARELAKSKGKEGWMFNLQYPSMLPVLMYADDRELRKTITIADLRTAIEGKYDNRPIIQKVISLRQKRAKLLGYKTHAEYVLEERMAEKPEKVWQFLERLYNVSMPKAKEEVKKLLDYAKKQGFDDEIQAWDYRYYGEKLKKELFDFDSEQLRPYFKMENVIDGIFKVANKLYGLEFIQNKELPVYHKDVKVYEVYDEDKNFVGLFYLDLFPRETKRSGAWMTTYYTQGLYEGEIKRPHVAIVANLTPSTEDKPSLLLLDEVTTIFHEFGHALHGLLSNCKYRTLASPSVYWDFVELPSQIMENWVYEKEALDLFAKHYETGESIPEEIINKIKEIRKFMAAIFTVRQLTFGYLDMNWHDNDIPENINVFEFEKKAIEKLRLFPDIEKTNISCGFGHIFAGGYSAGYYSYKWAEVLEADAFEYFKEKGIFNREVSTSFKENILAKGNTDHPMTLYINFRGREPDPDALLRRDGLL